MRIKNLFVSLFALTLVMFLVACDPYPLVLLFGENPPEPEIKYGEFPFKLVYEIDGEEKIVEDVLICEFDGFGANVNGRYRRWKEYLASGNERIFLWKGDSEAIYFYPKSGSYYIGDRGERDKFSDDNNGSPSSYFGRSFPIIIFYYETFPDGEVRHDILEADVLLEKFGIRLLSWEHAPPIENSFVER